MTLGQSSLQVLRLGVGAMTWGDPRGLARLHPAKLAYGGPHGFEEEKRALEASLTAGVNLFDTAAMYSGGAAERRLENLPTELEATLARLGRPMVDGYQHHYPSGTAAIPKLMERLADAVEAGKVRAVGVSNYSAEQMRIAHAALAGRGLSLASNQVEYSLLHRRPADGQIHRATAGRWVFPACPAPIQPPGYGSRAARHPAFARERRTPARSPSP